jgi:hypothetical protein
MEHFPSTMTRAESDGFAGRIDATLRERGWGLWAVEVAGGAPFIGFVGLHEERLGMRRDPADDLTTPASRPATQCAGTCSTG